MLCRLPSLLALPIGYIPTCPLRQLWSLSMITRVCIDSNLAHYTSALFRSVANLTFLTRSARCGDILSAALRAVVNCVKLLVVNMQPLVHFQSLY